LRLTFAAIFIVSLRVYLAKLHLKFYHIIKKGLIRFGVVRLLRITKVHLDVIDAQLCLKP